MNRPDEVFARYFEGMLSEKELSEFSRRLATDPDFVDAAVDAAVIDDALKQHAEASRGAAHAQWTEWFVTGTARGSADRGPLTTLSISSDSRTHSRRKPRLLSMLVILCFVVAGIVGTSFVILPKEAREVSSETSPQVAELTRTVNVRWENGGAHWSVGDGLCANDMVRLLDGRAEFRFECGAVMTLAGPAAMTLNAPQEVHLDYGTATTRLEGSNPGEFRVLTPSSEIVDLGTKFGVKVEPAGKTDVVVFDGEVDLTPVTRTTGIRLPSRRLSHGEAVRVSESGIIRRLTAIDRDAFPFGDAIFRASAARPPVITGAADDLRSPESCKFYRIDRQAFDDDIRAYVDRTHEWNGLTEDGIPHFLRGADYVATFNDDGKVRTSCPTITIQLSCPADVYLLIDDRTTIPDWLVDVYEDTGVDLGRDEGPSRQYPHRTVAVGPGKSIDYVASIWRRRYPKPGPVTLGPVEGLGASMIGIAAQPLN